MSSKSKNTKQNKKQTECSVDLFEELDDAIVYLAHLRARLSRLAQL